jgi:hypothetical protein
MALCRSSSGLAGGLQQRPNGTDPTYETAQRATGRAQPVESPVEGVMIGSSETAMPEAQSQQDVEPDVGYIT